MLMIRKLQLNEPVKPQRRTPHAVILYHQRQAHAHCFTSARSSTLLLFAVSHVCVEVVISIVLCPVVCMWLAIGWSRGGRG